MTTTPPIPREVYRELVAGLDELEELYGKSARVTVAREWLKRVAKAAQPEPSESAKISVTDSTPPQETT